VAARRRFTRTAPSKADRTQSANIRMTDMLASDAGLPANRLLERVIGWSLYAASAREAFAINSREDYSEQLLTFYSLSA
jgi:hypothetical protein